MEGWVQGRTGSDRVGQGRTRRWSFLFFAMLVADAAAVKAKLQVRDCPPRRRAREGVGIVMVAEWEMADGACNPPLHN